MRIAPVSIAPRFGAYVGFHSFQRQEAKLVPTNEGNALYVEADDFKDIIPGPAKYEKDLSGTGPRAARMVIELQPDGDITVHKSWGLNKKTVLTGGSSDSTGVKMDWGHTQVTGVSTNAKRVYHKPSLPEDPHPLKEFFDALAPQIRATENPQLIGWLNRFEEIVSPQNPSMPPVAPVATDASSGGGVAVDETYTPPEIGYHPV